MVQLNDIDFGYDDGLTEVKRSKNIDNMFYDDGNYMAKLEEGYIEVVQGRKGSGKSMLVSFFAKKMRQNNMSSTIKTMDSLRKRKLSLLGEGKISEEGANTLWQYIILDLLIEQYIKDFNLRSKQIEKLSGAQELAGLIIKEISDKKSNNNKLEAELSLSNLKASGAFGKNNESAVTYENRTKTYYENFEALYNTFISQVSRERKMLYLIIDDLDELSNGLEHNEFVRLSLKFVEAVHQLNGQFEDDNINARIIVTLRNDLAESMNKVANNLSKLMNDSSINLRWAAPSSRVVEPWNIPLIKMILTKIEASDSLSKGKTKKALYKSFFTNLKKNSYDKNSHMNFIMRNGFGRPRDAFMLLKECQDLYPEATSIDIQQLISSSKQYSHKFYQELVNEMHLNSDAEDLVKMIEVTIVGMGKRNFYLNELFSRWQEDGNHKDIMKFKRLVSSLYEYGVLGVRNSKTIVFSYWEGAPSRREFSLNVKMGIHNSIANHLSILS